MWHRHCCLCSGLRRRLPLHTRPCRQRRICGWFQFRPVGVVSSSQAPAQTRVSVPHRFGLFDTSNQVPTANVAQTLLSVLRASPEPPPSHPPMPPAPHLRLVSVSPSWSSELLASASTDKSVCATSLRPVRHFLTKYQQP